MALMICTGCFHTFAAFMEVGLAKEISLWEEYMGRAIAQESWEENMRLEIAGEYDLHLDSDRLIINAILAEKVEAITMERALP
jgi:hypothetical protein